MRKINRKRGNWAMAGINAFMRETGLQPIDGLDTAISDLLADIRHLCDVKKLDYSDLDRRALVHYNAEQSADTE